MNVAAQEVRVGDRMLMPDGTTWCEIESIHEEGDGRLFFLFTTPGFASLRPDEPATVRRQETNAQA